MIDRQEAGPYYLGEPPSSVVQMRSLRLCLLLLPGSSIDELVMYLDSFIAQ